MISIIWRDRAQAQYRAALERAEKLARMRMLHQGAGKGKMPHWSTYKRREGYTGVFTHLLRPPHDGVNGAITCCGWNQASFQSARTFNLPRHQLWAAAPDVRKFLTQGGSVGCAHCYDVANDIASWLALITGPRDEGETHLRWTHSRAGTACDFQGVVGTSQSLLYREFAHELGQAAALFNDEAQICSICTAIFGRLFGPNRPESEFATFTTNEEAGRL